MRNSCKIFYFLGITLPENVTSCHYIDQLMNTTSILAAKTITPGCVTFDDRPLKLEMNDNLLRREGIMKWQ